MIFKYKEKKQKFNRYDVYNQGLSNERVKLCWFPTTLDNKDIVWFEYVLIKEKCKLYQGIWGNFYVIWEPESITLIPTL